MMSLRTVLLLGLVTACSDAADYGEPNEMTTIDLQESGGFARQANGHGVRIEGNAATFTAGDVSEAVTVDAEQMQAIVRALEDIEFLALEDDYTDCKNPATDLPGASLQASLPAGSHELTYYLGCRGGMYTAVADLDEQIFGLSGYTAWLAAHPELPGRSTPNF